MGRCGNDYFPEIVSCLADVHLPGKAIKKQTSQIGCSYWWEEGRDEDELFEIIYVLGNKRCSGGKPPVNGTPDDGGGKSFTTALFVLFWFCSTSRLAGTRMMRSANLVLR